jgi:hypothetical protein
MDELTIPLEDAPVDHDKNDIRRLAASTWSSTPMEREPMMAR